MRDNLEKNADKNWAQKLCQNNSLYSDQSCKNNFKSNAGMLQGLKIWGGPPWSR